MRFVGLIYPNSIELINWHYGNHMNTGMCESYKIEIIPKQASGGTLKYSRWWPCVVKMSYLVWAGHTELIGYTRHRTTRCQYPLARHHHHVFIDGSGSGKSLSGPSVRYIVGTKTNQNKLRSSSNASVLHTTKFVICSKIWSVFYLNQNLKSMIKRVCLYPSLAFFSSPTSVWNFTNYVSIQGRPSFKRQSYMCSLIWTRVFCKANWIAVFAV